MTRFLVSPIFEAEGKEYQRNKAHPLFSRCQWLGGTRTAKTEAAFAPLPMAVPTLATIFCQFLGLQLEDERVP